MKKKSGEGSPRVGFFHPDLGIGGAERLVVDAALALQNRGCDVTIWTSHHDPSHAFPETTDGTLRVRVHGDWLPRQLFGRLHVLFAVLRAIWLAICAWRSSVQVAVVDQVSAAIPLIRIATGARVLFYCHFPDKLLAPRTTRAGFLGRMYRAPFDWLEERTTGSADRIVVNSRFTASVFEREFPHIRATPTVIYPCAACCRSADSSSASSAPPSVPTPLPVPDGKALIVSINRYERKKNVGLAVEAMAAARQKIGEQAFSKLHLVIAGGYDSRVQENVEHKQELAARVQALGLSANVTLLANFSEAERVEMLRRAACLLYTPENEHFGIVPIETMFLRVPVIAVNSGGPRETVSDGVTGFLRPPNADSFGEAIARIVSNPEMARGMGEAGRKSVIERFSFDSFGDQFHAAVLSLVP